MSRERRHFDSKRHQYSTLEFESFISHKCFLLITNVFFLVCGRNVLSNDLFSSESKKLSLFVLLKITGEKFSNKNSLSLLSVRFTNYKWNCNHKVKQVFFFSFSLNYVMKVIFTNSICTLLT